MRPSSRDGGACSAPVPVASRCHPVSWVWRRQNVNAHVLRGQAVPRASLLRWYRPAGLSGWWSGKEAACVGAIPRTCPFFESGSFRLLFLSVFAASHGIFFCSAVGSERPSLATWLTRIGLCWPVCAAYHSWIAWSVGRSFPGWRTVVRSFGHWCPNPVKQRR